MTSITLYTGLALLLMAALVYSESAVYRDPCHGKTCGSHGCCIRKNAYYNTNGIVQYWQHACACDDHYYWHREDNTCRHGCYQHQCGAYATCYPKDKGEKYSGSGSNKRYLPNYYYCKCNDGYQGDGHTCTYIDPCQHAQCHQYATCHPKLFGSTKYEGYASYQGYVQQRYYCKCNEDYYGNGKQCTHKCFGNNCHVCATCIPKNHGLDYPYSAQNPIYKNDYYNCVCKNGYMGTGRYCAVKDPCHGNNCHEHATCFPKNVGSTSYYNYPTCLGYVKNSYYCKCNDYYRGNGRSCTGYCDGNTCHSSATCVPKLYGSTNYPTYHQYPGYRNSYYYCTCAKGYFWNGRSCVPDPCARNNCHKHATCIRKTCGSIRYPGYGNYQGYRNSCYYCACKKPYSGNGRLCLIIGK